MDKGKDSKKGPDPLLNALEFLFSGEELEDSLVRFIPRLQELLGADFVVVSLWREREKVLVPVVSHGRALDTFPSKLPLGEGITGRVAAEKKALWVEDGEKDDRIHPTCKGWISSLMSAPLFVEDKLYGVISVARKGGRRGFSREEFFLFQKIARYLSGFIELSKIMEDGYHAFALAVEAREPKYRGHALAVARISRALAVKAGMRERERKLLYWAALLHDVGKVVVPDVILVKPLPLDGRERLVVSLHSQLGAAIISLIEPLKDARVWILHHHERWDGKGYPSGLKGEEIPLASRIIHLAESFHAMAYPASSFEGVTKDRIREELLKGRGAQWDPRLVDLLLEDMDIYWRILEESIKSPYPKELEEVHSEVTSILFSMEILKDLSSVIVNLSDANAMESMREVLGRLAFQMGWQGVSLLDQQGRVLVAVNTEDTFLEVDSQAREGTVEIRWGDYTYYLRVKGRGVSHEEERILEGLKSFLAGLIGLLFHGEGRILRDDLTGVYTLSSIREFFVSVAPKVGRMAVVILDLDGFKRVNDRFGHEMGNRVLQRLASFLEENLRDSDFLGRYGGDEFVVLLPKVDKEEVRRIMDRIRGLLEETVLVDGVFPISFSYGMASYPEDGVVFEDLLRLADRRMYAEKTRRKGALVSAMARESLRLGQSCDLSKAASFLGREYKKGLEAGFKWGAEKYGERVELVTLDDGYEPDLCAMNTERLLKDEQVLALAGYVGTPTSAVVVPLAENSGVPFLFPLSGASFLRWPPKRWVFNLRPSYLQEVEALLKGVVEGLGIREVGIFYQDDTYGWEILGAAESTLLRYKMGISGKGSYRRNSLDVAGAFETLMDSSPQAVILAGTCEPCSLFVRMAREKNWTPLFLAVSYVGGEAFIKRAGRAGEGTVFTQVVPHPGSRLPLVEEFVRVIGDGTPTHVSLEGFLGALLLVEALKGRKDVTRESLVKGLEALGEVEMGGLTFHLDGHDRQALSRVYYTVVKNGELVPFQDFSQLSSLGVSS